MKIRIDFKDHQRVESQNLSSQDVIAGEISLLKDMKKTDEKDFSATYTDFKVKRPKWDVSMAENYQTQSARILNELL